MTGPITAERPYVAVAGWVLRGLTAGELAVLMAILSHAERDTRVIEATPAQIAEIVDRSLPTVFRALKSLRRRRVITQVLPGQWEIDPEVGFAVMFAVQWEGQTNDRA
jgi:hypothetical protein